jgi:hypothetical protein
MLKAASVCGFFYLTQVATLSNFYRRVTEDAEKCIKNSANSAPLRFKTGKFATLFESSNLRYLILPFRFPQESTKL